MLVTALVAMLVAELSCCCEGYDVTVNSYDYGFCLESIIIHRNSLSLINKLKYDIIIFVSKNLKFQWYVKHNDIL